ncbi:hypothetical protein EMIHUDRAFT_260295 [Emiliania huxleyi CCMP1516]|uniref:Phosphoribosylformylglycinamidine synthase N-terminal domain-containing protein n=2 Tax=Emiliania huxleyi TaxID=2903 RepID=A0A0D3KWC5_EMIH1|nr:hypothetical protein EMIHUDRAFT_260295 [Emiliania huxleyi CCMP1516]EOD40060.1 hypothetical protein EMIHUDRAFT_260295 [Emiliania huxleyi CCMP1516]|eukprot:XP_005792489.1 hypothetical protein EMIHUDRAFT_260295 [Emiliania huxleyi CCMP1516]
MLLEVGPRLTFATAWSSNAVAICQSAGLRSVARVEMSRRYLISTAEPLTPALRAAVSAALHDRMTEQDSLDGSTPYSLPLEMVLGKLPPKTFVSDRKPYPSKPLSLPDGLTVADALGRPIAR